MVSVTSGNCDEGSSGRDIDSLDVLVELRGGAVDGTDCCPGVVGMLSEPLSRGSCSLEDSSFFSLTKLSRT